MGQRFVWRAAVLVLLLPKFLLGCSDVQSTEPSQIEPLITHQSWAFTDASADILPEERPINIGCDDLSGWYAERDWLEISTAACDYFSGETPTLLELREGDIVRVQLSHYELAAEEAAKAHFVVALNGEIELERSFDIPSPADQYFIDFKVSEAIAPGATIQIHLHNHGENTWQLRNILRVR